MLLCAASLPAISAPSAHADEANGGSRIVVTATAFEQKADETATPVIVLRGDDLVHRRQATLGDTLAGQPGINFDNFGGGASRPVIRGQTAPRVQSLSDGANIQDASAVSPDHAVTAEPLLLEGIEVLRGPSALLYGGGAIGGAINLIDGKVPTALPEGGFSGVAEGRLGTADDERSLVGGLTAGIGPFAIHVEGVRRTSDDYRIPKKFGDRHVDGSYNDTSTFSVGGSWVGPDGYLGVAYTRQRSEYGLPGHSHEYESCHPHGTSLHCGSHDDHDHDHDHDHEHDHDEVPYVKLRSERFDIRSEYRNPLPGLEKVRLRMAFTDYEHDELEHDEISTTFRNKAHDIRFELTHKPLAGLRGIFGVQHSSSRFSAVGEEAFLPQSDTENTALFLMETLAAGQVRFEVAARQEWQSIETTLNRRVTHQPFSISGAAIWNVGSDYSLSLSLARSQRAPNAQELFARGVHLATNTYEMGSAALGTETAKSIDVTLRKTAGATTFTIGAYHQDFSDYIFAETLDRFEDFRLIRYTAADARFTGIDGEVRQQITPEFALSIFGDYVRAKLKDGLGNLPRIPAGRLGGRTDGRWGPLSADLEYYRVFEQGKVASFETRTPGYDMVNATLAYKLALGPQANAELFVRGNNLTNALAFNHASFIKQAAPLRGRNFTFGVRSTF
ncbi:TonB-dependent outer membrane receptor [Novosphingobium sp. PY1]|nr:TonB-dependent outer membrane receptor [Novosphingobium sp. PY1]